MRVLPQAVDLDLFCPGDGRTVRDAMGFTPQDVVVYFAGSMVYWHGVNVFIESLPDIMARCPEVRVMMVVGCKAQDLKNLERTLRQLGIEDRVRVCSGIPYRQMPGYHSAADICLAPHINEANRPLGCSPKKLTEYFACARAVICSDLPELREMGRECAVYVKPGALAEAIISLAQDPNRRHRLGESAHRLSYCQFDRTVRTTHLLTFYEQVLQMKKKHRLGDLSKWAAIQFVRVLRQR